MKNKKIIFRPNSKIEEQTTPSPESSKKNMPTWYKNIKRFINNGITLNGSKDFFNSKTIKTCIPFFDSITCGYYYKLPYDLYCSYDKLGNRIVEWGNKNYEYIGNHKMEQIGDYPIPEGYEKMILKIHTSWGIQTPKGYSLIYMHPLGRLDLPFYSFHGIVDSDIFCKSINIPIVLKSGFEGLIKQGTPISQVIPIKREHWKSDKKNFNEDKNKSVIDNIIVISAMEKWYMHNKWVKKQYD